VDFNFTFIENITNINDNELTIYFTQSYTYFLANTELLDYSKYVDDIIALDKMCSIWSKEEKLSRNINADFLKAIVRYMLQHNGKNNQIRISRLIKKLNLDILISKEQLKKILADLKRPKVQQYLKEKFGISLTANGTTLTFNELQNKKHYFIENK